MSPLPAGLLFRWFSEFREEQPASSSAESGPGRDRTTRTRENIQSIQKGLEDDCKTSVRELADCLDIGKSSVHEILTQDLHLRNVSSVWVPHQLTEANKETRVNCAKSIRRAFFREGMESFCNKLAVQDETWPTCLANRANREIDVG